MLWDLFWSYDRPMQLLPSEIVFFDYNNVPKMLVLFAINII